ncbi:unnamed protein product [Caenorhabditis angaria]|uniref:Glucosamine-6-phosphate deaminase n=1 Tax=Caenorhabditis angaria TaxID=860376 RepID=A0A9P1N1C4_9PELO|nr:unnamed protein product [Caenorhabditis angaria]
MKLIIEESSEKVAEFAAGYVAKKIIEHHRNPSNQKYFVLGLPTGSTPLGMYRKLIEYYQQGRLSFKYVKTFNMDEYVGLERDHPESYHSFMFHNFFKHIDIDPKNTGMGSVPKI